MYLWQSNYLAFGKLCRDVLHFGRHLLSGLPLQQCRDGKMRVCEIPCNPGLTSSLCISCTPFCSSLHGSTPHLLQCSRSRCRHVLRRRRLESLRNSHTSNGQSSGSSRAQSVTCPRSEARGVDAVKAKAACRERSSV